jgi:hypothetical protein
LIRHLDQKGSLSYSRSKAKASGSIINLPHISKAIPHRSEVPRLKEIEEEDDENKDPYDLATHTVCLDEEQCEKWLKEMHNHGINF